ncbi:MAG TPA: hypothetical protein VFC46_05330 [Humisphaera sp.]|nr:hypothetical protein [Humisphaera sp.]
MPSSDEIQVLPVTRRERGGQRDVASRDARKLQPDTAASSTQAYLRQVRRLRQQYAGDPGRLQQRLGELSRSHDKAHPRIAPLRRVERPIERCLIDSDVPRGVSDRPPLPPQTPFSRAVVDWFADHVASQLDERLLHFSKRQVLLKTAQNLGIGRFHANLIIAVAQHQAGRHAIPPVTFQPARGRSLLVTVSIILMVQALIVAAVWFMLHGG